MTDRPADEVRLEELASKATKGEWDKHGLEIAVFGRGVVATCPTPQNSGVMECANNANYFFACDPQSILTLLSRLTALRAERDEAREMHKTMCDLALYRAGEIERAESERDAANARVAQLMIALGRIEEGHHADTCDTLLLDDSYECTCHVGIAHRALGGASGESP